MATIPRAEPGLYCPLWRKPMEKVCHTCPWWMEIRGRNANTGKDIDSWGCAVGFLPMLLIENAQQTRGAAAATETLRNDLVDGIVGAVQVAADNAGRFIDARDDHRR
jgi:hypothetical protein